MNENYLSLTFPDSVTFWPLMGVAAFRNGCGGAWRIWLLAKSLDDIGRGAIPQNYLEMYAMHLQIHRKSYLRWHTKAEKLKLITKVSRKSGAVDTILAGHAKAAYFIGCKHVGSRRARTRVALLVKKGWRAHIWAAYITTHLKRPISRAKMREITDVPESTQLVYEKETGVRPTPNYLVSNMSLDKLIGVREFERNHAFPYWDKVNKRWTIAWRAPDSRDASFLANCMPPGRTRKINKYLRSLSGSSYVGRASSKESEYIRLFNDSPQTTEFTLRKLAREGPPPWEVSEVFELTHRGENADFWKTVKR